MSEGCLPDRPSRPRRSPVVLLIVILVIAMMYSLTLIYLQVPVTATIAVLSAVAAVTVRLTRPDGAEFGTGPTARG